VRPGPTQHIYDLRAQLDISLLMSRLDTILNPQDNVIPTLRSEYVYYNALRRPLQLSLLDRVERVPSPRLNSSSPTSSAGELSRTSKFSHSRQDSKEHCAHPTCPDTLRCLPDTDERPQHTLPVILRCAILGSKMKRLTIREIYAAMEEKYPYYKTAGSTWKVCFLPYLIGDYERE
jgi:Forkhead domain